MVISFVCLLPVRLLRPNVAVLYHMNGKLQRAYYYRLLSNSRKAFLFSYVSGDLEKLVFPVVSQDNGNLAFCRGQVFSMVCLLPLTARFKLQLGDRNAFFFVNHNLVTLQIGTILSASGIYPPGVRDIIKKCSHLFWRWQTFPCLFDLILREMGLKMISDTLICCKYDHPRQTFPLLCSAVWSGK